MAICAIPLLTPSQSEAQAAPQSTRHSAAAKAKTRRAVTRVRLSPRDLSLYGQLLQMQDRRVLDTVLVNRALTNTSPAVRAATAFALSQIASVNRTAVEPMLRTLAADKDTAVAANADFGLKLLTYAPQYDTAASRDTMASRRPLTWYDSVVQTVVVPTLAGTPPRVTITTDNGVIHLAILGTQAPITAAHFLALVKKGFYNGLIFHRVVPNFVAQGGDPTGTGRGGPGYAMHDEFNREPYTRGAVGIATSGPDTGGSQFYLSLADIRQLDGKYTLFARVTDGLEVMDAIKIGDKMISVTTP